MNNLCKQHLIDSANLDEQFYLQSLMQEGLRTRLLDQTGLKKIQTQLMETLAFETRRYTHGESSSVRIETAENILKSIAYTLGIFLKTIPPDDGIALLRDKPLKGMLASGRDLIKRKYRIAKLTYLECKASWIKTPNLPYNDTMVGIFSFFSAYDIEFGAHETPAMIDYPVSGAHILTGGVEYILEYVKRLLSENRYCSRFLPGQIHAAMLRFDPGYADLLVNIYDQVLKCLSADGTLPEASLETPRSAAVFEDGIRMGHDEFRTLTEKIGNCQFAMGKAELIQQNVRSFTDLTEILSAGCLYGEEFNTVFTSLDEPFLALLLQETADREDLHTTEYEKEWQERFIRFLNALEPARRNRIAGISKEITLPEFF